MQNIREAAIRGHNGRDVAELEMTMNSEEVSDLLDEILKSVKEETKEFPPLPLLQNVKELLEFLANLPRKKDFSYNHRTWPDDLRVIIRRLLQTFKIQEDYLNYCYELVALGVLTLGVVWFNPDPQFLVLISGLASGRLRILMDKPEEINTKQVIPCLTLLEFFIGAIEDSDFVDEQDATALSKHVQEAASFILEYLAKCEEENILLDMELLLVLYRFICSFLAVGGAEILNKDLLNGSIKTLVKVSRFCLKQNDAKTAGLLILSLPDFPSLPEDTLDLIIDYLRQLYPTKEAKNSLIQMCSILEPLKERRGWFTSQSKKFGLEFAEAVKDVRLIDILNRLSD